MNNEKQEIRISKFLSLILRHHPQIIGIDLDQNGWTDVNLLIEKANDYGVNFDFEILRSIVQTNSKNRFAFTDNFKKIRASQGHSIGVDLGYTNQKPSEILYNGTSEKSVQSIFLKGLEKRNRQHVHLSSDIKTAIRVGQRHGNPQIFMVLSHHVFNDKFESFISDSGAWLTDHVPPKYLKLNVE